MKTTFRKRNRAQRIRAELAVFFAGCLLLASCTSGSQSVSVLQSADSFSQNADSVNNKIDILWVVDNSGSMDPYQAKLAANFNSFISQFQTKGFDFQIGVTTTDAYLAGANFYSSSGRSQLRDGAKIYSYSSSGVVSSTSNHTGFPIITNTLGANVTSTFATNATQGSAGSGDERAFQSLVETLDNSTNSSFHRAGAFLAVIILSDEDDFSDAIGASAVNSRAEGGGTDHDYNSSKLMRVADLEAYLDNLTSANSTNRSSKYNVSAISVLDSNCQTSHAAASVSTIISTRYIQLATDTSGIMADICQNSYANSLNYIQQRISELTTQFKLSKQPDPASIAVLVAGVSIAGDATNGWTYDATSNAIMFHGTAVPAASAKIQVTFNPTSLSN